MHLRSDWLFGLGCLGLVFLGGGIGVGLHLSNTGCAPKLFASGSVYAEVRLHHSSVCQSESAEE